MTDRLSLPPRYRRMLEELLREHVPNAEVWAYGSRINGENHEGSDLDLVVRGPALEPLGVEFIDLVEALQQSNIPILVQAHDWSGLPDGFHREIERDYVVVQQGATLEVTKVWREATLADVATIVMGQSPPGRTVSNEPGVALLNGPTEFGPHHPTPVQFTSDPRRFAQPGDVLFCVRGSTTGRMNWADQEYAIGRGVAAIRHTEDPALQPLLRGAIEVALPELLIAATGSTFPNVSASQIADIPYPDLTPKEQRAIAHVLGTLDDKIELNRRMSETLEAMAQALFKSWFMDFEPVRAKMEGRWQRGESLPGLPAEHYDLFPDRLVDSELGEIPEGWEVKTLGDVVEVVGGTTPSTKVPSYWDGGLHCWATPKDLSVLSSPVLLDTERHITDAGLEKIPTGLLPAGTLLLSSRAPIGYVAISEEPLAVNQGFIAIPPSNTIPTQFMLRWCAAFKQVIENYANGSTFLEISKSNFRLIRIALPDEQVLQEFDQLACSLYHRVVANEQEVRALKAQRDAMLPSLVSGEVRVA